MNVAAAGGRTLFLFGTRLLIDPVFRYKSCGKQGLPGQSAFLYAWSDHHFRVPEGLLALIQEKPALLFRESPGSLPIRFSGAVLQPEITANSTYWKEDLVSVDLEYMERGQTPVLMLTVYGVWWGEIRTKKGAWLSGWYGNSKCQQQYDDSMIVMQVERGAEPGSVRSVVASLLILKGQSPPQIDPFDNRIRARSAQKVSQGDMQPVPLTRSRDRNRSLSGFHKD